MRAWFGMAAALLLSACATMAGGPGQRDMIARQIADDAAAFNEAYAQAVSGQILLNIFRSRDRLPRQYLAVTGISDAPSVRYAQSAGIGSIPLGEGGAPWGFGNVGVERETVARPGYAVQPYDAPALTRTVFEPTQPYIFARYWRGGWPRDLLLLVMVDEITVHRADGTAQLYSNEANEIFEDCAPNIETNGCAFVRMVRAFLVRTQEHGRFSTARRAQEICGLVDVFAPTIEVRPRAPRDNERCEPTFVAGGDRYTLRLRSLDDMVYYVGELMRTGAMSAGPGEAIEAPVTIRAAGLRGGGRGVPLFRIVPAGAGRHTIYAAEVNYGGRRYRAGPAIGRSCAEAAAEGPCQDTPEEGDRSSSVISLIAEILALNQSPDAIRPPNRLIAE